MSSTKPHLPLSDAELGKIAANFRMLGEPMRLKILQSVCDGPRTVSEIVAATGSTQANISKHLSLLAAADLLVRTKSGQSVYYRMKDGFSLKLCQLVREQWID